MEPIFSLQAYADVLPPVAMRSFEVLSQRVEELSERAGCSWGKDKEAVRDTVLKIIEFIDANWRWLVPQDTKAGQAARQSLFHQLDQLSNALYTAAQGRPLAERQLMVIIAVNHIKSIVATLFQEDWDDFIRRFRGERLARNEEEEKAHQREKLFKTLGREDPEKVQRLPVELAAVRSVRPAVGVADSKLRAAAAPFALPIRFPVPTLSVKTAL